MKPLRLELDLSSDDKLFFYQQPQITILQSNITLVLMRKNPKPKLIKKTTKEEYFTPLIHGMENFITIQMIMLKILK